MTLVPDITLQFLKWRYQSHPGAKRAYEWVREDIERLGWQGWLTAKDELLMAERERLLNEQNQIRVDKLHSRVFTLELLVGQGVGWHPQAWNELRGGIGALARHNERLTASLMVYATMRHSLYFLTRLSRRKRT